MPLNLDIDDVKDISTAAITLANAIAAAFGPTSDGGSKVTKAELWNIVRLAGRLTTVIARSMAD